MHRHCLHHRGPFYYLITEPDSVIVHVIRGENSAAMQHESGASAAWDRGDCRLRFALAVIYILGLLLMSSDR